MKHPNELLKCTLKPSKIHGIGVFAIRDIKKGEKMYCGPLKSIMWSGPWRKFAEDLYPEVKELIIQRYPVVLDDKPFRIDNVELVCFMNHSDDNNYDKHTDTALVDIKKGEEVTEDYGKYKDVLLNK